MQFRPCRVSFTLSAFVLMAVCNSTFADPKPASSIPTVDLTQPADLAAALRKSGDATPLILQVGFRTLYDQSHIVGAEYVGATGDDKGLDLLRERVATLPKDTSIVIYCGCCPWSHCPNIAAAYSVLHGLGFSKLKVLYIADNFGSDWVDKGYPSTKGS